MQSKWKKIIAVLMIAVFVLSGCGSIGGKKNSANGTVHLTFGHGQAEGHPYHKAALYFKEQVENKTNGRVIVDIQPNGNLGDEREMTEGLQLGTIDITVAVAAIWMYLISHICLIQENRPFRYWTARPAKKSLTG